MGDVDLTSPIISFTERIVYFMKRVLAALLCAGLLVVFASGCMGGQQANPNAATGDEASSLEAMDYKMDDKDVKDITIELYEFDTQSQNATADEVVKSVKADGTFSILELPDVKAYLSDNGKFLMIYNDKGLDESKTDSDNYKWREEVLEKFKSFHSNEK